MTISTICSPPRWRCCHHVPPRVTAYAPRRLRNKNTTPPLRFSGPQFLKHEALGFARGLRFAGAKLGFCLKAENGGGLGERKSGGEKDEEDKEWEELRDNTSLPDRFRPLTKEVPEPPLRWPWFVALAFLIYAWRSVLWELSKWMKPIMGILGIFHFVGYLLNFAIALIFHFIGDPLTYTSLCIETMLHAARSFYLSIVTSAPILELTIIIVLASGVLAIGEAASPNSVNCQPYLLTSAGVIGYAAVRGVISEPVFWLMLFALFSYGKFVKKRDYVTSALPVATVLASVGESWVRLLSIISFTALAIHQHSKRPAEEKVAAELAPSSGKVPFPLLAVALAIGIRLAAKWAGYRHLTWMIV